MPRDLKELVVSIISNTKSTESKTIKRLEPILESHPNIVHAKISKDVLNSVITFEYQHHDNVTLLHLAARWNYTEIARFLIKKGADVDAIDKEGNTPLHEAALNDKKEVAELLVEHEAVILKENLYGRTPLRKAALYSHEVMVKLLLEKAYGVDALTSYEFVSIMHNPKLTEDEKVKQLRPILRKNPDIIDDRISYDISVSVTSEYGKYQDNTTLLHIAAVCDYAKIAELLIYRRANIHAITDNEHQDTPLHRAVLHGSEKVAELLLDCGAKIESKTNYGYTPLHIAALHNSNAVMVKLLLSKGADVSALTDSGKTAEDLSVENRHKETFFVLKEAQKAAQPKRNISEIKEGDGTSNRARMEEPQLEKSFEQLSRK